KGDLESAERTLEVASEAPGATREVFYNLGEIKLSKSRPDDALKAYQRAAMMDPTWGKPVYAMGRLALARSDSSAAATFFQKTIDIDPASPEAAQAKAALAQIKK